MKEEKERLLSRLKKWTAEGFRLRPDTTHMYMEGSLLQADMMKIDKKAHYWSCLNRSWQEYERQLNPHEYLPLSLLSETELAEFQ